MILMIDFDAIQPVITDEGLQYPRREHLLAAPSPRVGDHCKATRLVHQVDAAIHLDRVAVNMRWATIGQEAIECLLPIANMTRLDQRVSDMRATDRGTFADLSHHLCLANRHTKLCQLRENTGQSTQPAVAYSSHLSCQARTRRISAVRQDVHTAAATRAGEFHSAYYVDP
jgi:hypothetical protein